MHAPDMVSTAKLSQHTCVRAAVREQAQQQQQLPQSATLWRSSGFG
jgi:hypothetical protein